MPQSTICLRAREVSRQNSGLCILEEGRLRTAPVGGHSVKQARSCRKSHLSTRNLNQGNVVSKLISSNNHRPAINFSFTAADKLRLPARARGSLSPGPSHRRKIRASSLQEAWVCLSSPCSNRSLPVASVAPAVRDSIFSGLLLVAKQQVTTSLRSEV